MEFRPECGRCHDTLTNAGRAYFCAFECTYCATCARTLRFICPNCSGELVRRPRQGTAPKPGLSVAPDSTLSARRATPADLDGLAPLFDAYRVFYSQKPDLLASRRFLKDRLERGQSEIWVAVESDQVVGFVQLYPLFSSVSLGPILVLNDLFVVPGARRRGVGALLLAAARDFGTLLGAHYLELSTAVDNPAQSLYEQSGWLLDREFLHYELPLRPRPTGGE
jgi:GNAT superfamily N-acetyltransferase